MIPLSSGIIHISYSNVKSFSLCQWTNRLYWYIFHFEKHLKIFEFQLSKFLSVIKFLIWQMELLYDIKWDNHPLKPKDKVLKAFFFTRKYFVISFPLYNCPTFHFAVCIDSPTVLPFKFQPGYSRHIPLCVVSLCKHHNYKSIMFCHLCGLS